jgi:hypothetical protein
MAWQDNLHRVQFIAHSLLFALSSFLAPHHHIPGAAADNWPPEVDGWVYFPSCYSSGFTWTDGGDKICMMWHPSCSSLSEACLIKGLLPVYPPFLPHSRSSCRGLAPRS